MFDAGAHGFEDDARVVREVGNKFGFVEEAAVARVKGGGQVPVEERDHRSDAGGEQVVGEFDIVARPFWLMGSLRPPRGMMRDLEVGVSAGLDVDERGEIPGKRVSVCFGAAAPQQLDIFGCAVVRIACDVAAAAVCDLAGFLAVHVPDGGAAAVFLGGAFDLVTGSG